MGMEDEVVSSKRGALIVIEGLDRAGKSTQCARLSQALQAQGHSVKSIRFPGKSPKKKYYK